MDVKIIHFYPDLMTLYGSYANVSAVRRLLERLGHTVSVETVAPGQDAALSGADFLFMGAGTERRQGFAQADFARFGADVKALAADGCSMLFAGTAMELLGASVTDAAGTVRPGIGLAEFTAVQGKQRFVEDVYGHTDLFPEPVVGFMNKCANISGVETPLLTALDLGYGNEAEKGPEGFRRDNVFASELTGPILLKNPKLLEAVVSAILRRRGAPEPETWPLDAWTEQGYAITEEQLRLRCGK